MIQLSEAINRYITLIGILFPEETKEHGYGQFMLGNIYMRTDHLINQRFVSKC
ncbi:MAG: hypothetical protein IPK25_16345 [Saprospiraceae bacterium]|nr:hypothetical protein [Saprospiraceae bacterium]